MDRYPSAKGFFVSSEEVMGSLTHEAGEESGSRAAQLSALLRSKEWETAGVSDFHGTFTYFRSPTGVP